MFLNEHSVGTLITVVVVATDRFKFNLSYSSNRRHRSILLTINFYSLIVSIPLMINLTRSRFCYRYHLLEFI